jgi:hypothetical protein
MATTIKKRPRNGFPSVCKQLGASNSASVLTERGQTIFQFIRFCSNKIDAGAQAVRTQRWPLTAKIKHPIGDILKTYEDASTSTAAAAADSSNAWTDLLSAFDAPSAARRHDQFPDRNRVAVLKAHCLLGRRPPLRRRWPLTCAGDHFRGRSS